MMSLKKLVAVAVAVAGMTAGTLPAFGTEEYDAIPVGLRCAAAEAEGKYRKVAADEGRHRLGTAGWRKFVDDRTKAYNKKVTAWAAIDGKVGSSAFERDRQAQRALVASGICSTNEGNDNNG